MTLQNTFPEFGRPILYLCLLLTVWQWDLVEARQNQYPETYQDDIFHCENPLETPPDSITCDGTTWMWNIQELTEEAPPVHCDGLDDLTTETVETAEDAMEPCVLWAMLYGNLQPTAAPTAPDDLWHCRIPEAVDPSISITCDPVTMLWNVQELDEDAPPSMCGDNFEIPPEEIANVQDWFEPCVLWAMAYGNLMPTAAPTLLPSSSPTTATPTLAPTSAPTQMPVPVATYRTIELDIQSLAITLVWAQALDSAFSLDRGELRTLTQNHILESLKVELGSDIVQQVQVTMKIGIPKTQSYTETITGTVTLKDALSDEITETELQAYILRAFYGNGLELYLFRLQIAEDPTLNEVQSIQVGTTTDDGSAPNSLPTLYPISDDGDDGLDAIMLTIIISASSALLAVCLFGYCMLCRGSSKPAKKVLAAKEPTRRAAAGASRDSRSRQAPDIAAIPTQSSSMEDYVIHKHDIDDDEENQRSISNFTASEMDEQSEVGDEQSVGTSVYSYYNDDKSLMGASVANSFFTSLLDSRHDGNSIDGSNKPKKKGLLWSVMDTLQAHFGNDSDQSADEYDIGMDGRSEEGNGEAILSPMTADTFSNMLGPETNVSDNESEKSDSQLYEEEKVQDPTNTEKALLDDNKNAEEDDAFNTPVKERLERLWQDDDDNEFHSAPQAQYAEVLQATLKKSNLGTTRGPSLDQYEDENDSTDVVRLEEDSPTVKVLLSSTSLKDAPPPESISKHAAKIVNRIPDDDVSVPLPAKLNTAANRVDTDGAESHTDESEVSNNSSLSNNSSEPSGRRQLFNNNLSDSQKIQSARHKRGSWGINSDRSVASSKSGVSTDSAKYRSLLSQGDTNDAALFGLQEETTSRASVSMDTAPESNVLDDVDEGTEHHETSVQESNPTELSTLIQSFDSVWANDGSESKPSEPAPVADEKLTSEFQTKQIAPLARVSQIKRETSVPVDIDSDEDVYVEEDEDDQSEIDEEETESVACKEDDNEPLVLNKDDESKPVLESEELSQTVDAEKESEVLVTGGSFDEVEQSVPFEDEKLDEENEDNDSLSDGKSSIPRTIDTMASF